LLTTVLQHNQW